MKSRAPLALMEQMVMLLVFALAAALCLQAFVKSDQISLKSETRSNAALAAQNTAEIIRHSGGTLEHALTETAERQGGRYLEEDAATGGKLIISYDEEWKPAEEGIYFLTVEGIPVEEEGLCKVLVQVTDSSGEVTMSGQAAAEDTVGQEILFELETAWLEVEENE